MPDMPQMLEPEGLPEIAQHVCCEDEPTLVEARTAVGLLTPPASRADCVAILQLAYVGLDLVLCPTVTADTPDEQAQAELDHTTRWLVRVRHGLDSARRFLEGDRSDVPPLVRDPQWREDSLVANSRKLRELAASTCRDTRALMDRKRRTAA
jgi:hypothetical protein